MTENPKSARPEPESNEKPEKLGWTEGLAKKSTGLPGDVTPKDKPASDPSAWKYAGLGLQFAGTVGLFVLMGYALDRQMGWTPWGLVSFTVISVIGGLYLLIKELMKANADTEDQVRKK